MFIVAIFQEWPRQTKPKKGQLINFSRGHSATKVQCESCLFPKEKHQNSQKWAKFMNISFWPFLWFGLPGRLLHFCVSTRSRRNCRARSCHLSRATKVAGNKKPGLANKFALDPEGHSHLKKTGRPCCCRPNWARQRQEKQYTCDPDGLLENRFRGFGPK